ncbi:endomucin isoform X2 [Neopsephotus bourkii]|uniref:endomucin isoform X2 n=1 Tax=Neopsephotus bourkii TaxID=309878 RepID=UPI002AA534EB|nr:endomucin isoform X2 [Neopsephotus bourkii]XP_061216908.1 endomucin isoform X2 [Neopsephotus bourkii]
MKLLGIAFFFLVALCVCTVGENGVQTSTASATAPASTSKSVTEAFTASTSRATTSQAPVLTTTAIRATDESITSSSTPSASTVTQQITQGTTTQPPVEVTTTAAYKSDSTTNTTQANGTQLAQNESSDASSTKGWFSSSTEGSSFSPTISLQKTTSAPGTSGLHLSSPTQSTNLGFYSPESTRENKKGTGSDNHYSSVILPVVITLIVITLSVFSLVSLYRICQKKTPERQENSTEQAQSDKEGVKLLSVKTTSSDTDMAVVQQDKSGAGQRTIPPRFLLCQAHLSMHCSI